MTSRLSVRFMARHPLFGRKKKSGEVVLRRTEAGVAYKDSAYFSWWHALRLSEDYREVCTKQGKDCSEKWAKLYEDFGDVHASSFQDWWKERGERLFGEAASLSKVSLITVEDIDGLSESQAILIAIPRHLSKRQIATAVRRIVSKAHAGKRGRSTVATRHALSQAKYKVNHFKSTAVIARALSIVEDRRKGVLLKNLRRGNEKLGFEEITSVSRLAKMGRTIIAGVERGKFPITR